MKKVICPKADQCPYHHTERTCVHKSPHIRNDSCRHDKSQPIECPWCREIAAAREDKAE